MILYCFIQNYLLLKSLSTPNHIKITGQYTFTISMKDTSKTFRLFNKKIIPIRINKTPINIPFFIIIYLINNNKLKAVE